MSTDLDAPISTADLDSLLVMLDVSLVKLSECLVSPGWRLTLSGVPAAALHYNIKGAGWMIVEGYPAIDLKPHTLIIVPPGPTFHIETRCGDAAPANLHTARGNPDVFAPGMLQRFVAGPGEPDIVLICGFLKVVLGSTIDLFGSLSQPLVQQFGDDDGVDQTLMTAVNELFGQEVGRGAMTTALVKQVIVILLRGRSETACGVDGRGRA